MSGDGVGRQRERIALVQPVDRCLLVVGLELVPPYPYLQSASLDVGVADTADVTVTGQAGAQCGTADDGIALVPGNGITLPVIAFSIGPVPVVIVPSLQFLPERRRHDHRGY